MNEADEEVVEPEHKLIFEGACSMSGTLRREAAIQDSGRLTQRAVR
jgi:hypothetical protein